MARHALQVFKLFTQLPCLLLAASLLSGCNAELGIADYHTAVNLNETNLNTILKALPRKSIAVIEFYASWCPHCRHYAPEFEKIAVYFKTHPLEDGSHVFVGRVDCAAEVKLCGNFSIPSYPSLTSSHPETYIARGNITFLPSEHKREAPDVVHWVGERMNMTLVYEAVELPPAASELAANGTGTLLPLGPAWTMEDVEGATIQLFDTIMASPLLHTGANKRAALLDVINLWAAAHPSKRCQAGAQKLAAFFSQQWPDAADVAPEGIRKYKVCGEEAPEEPHYVTCKGSVSGSRGFTCALWLLFHTSADRLMFPEGGKILMTMLRAFAQHFFQCEVCQKHFTEVLSRPAAAAVVSRDDAIFWLWQTHNEVNSRLAEVEKKYGHSSSGDPAVVKVQFPTAEACAKCRKSSAAGDGKEIEWDRDEVLRYLARMYGETSEPHAKGADTGRNSTALSIRNGSTPGQGSSKGSSSEHRKIRLGDKKAANPEKETLRGDDYADVSVGDGGVSSTRLAVYGVCIVGGATVLLMVLVLPVRVYASFCGLGSSSKGPYGRRPAPAGVPLAVGNK